MKCINYKVTYNISCFVIFNIFFEQDNSRKLLNKKYFLKIKIILKLLNKKIIILNKLKIIL